MDILICVGASEFGLDRLLKYVDELCEEKVLDGNRIVAQTGCSKYKPIYYKSFKLIDRDDFIKYVDKSDVMISHAGTGSVTPALKKGKKVIVFPRLKDYGEHIDNHQLELAEVFTVNGYTMCATTKEELKDSLLKISSFVPKKFISNTENMNRLIIETIDNWFK